MGSLVERAEIRDIVKYGRSDALPGRSWSPSQRREILRRLEAGLPIASGAAQLTANFEAGVNGNTILTADTGSANAWDAIFPASLTDGTRAYDNTHAAHGTLAAKILAATTDKQIYLQWSTALGTITADFGRIYLYITATPAAGFTFVKYLSGSNGGAGIALLSATRKFTIGDAGGTVATSTSVVPLNQWVRFEWAMTCSATVGNMTVKYFSVADATTPDETLGGAGTYNTKASVNTVRFGNTSAVALTTAFWMDSILVGAGAYPGPDVVAQSLGPRVLGLYTQ